MNRRLVLSAEDGNGGIRRALAYDGVHPTAEGYEAMNSVAEKAIRQVRQ